VTFPLMRRRCSHETERSLGQAMHPVAIVMNMFYTGLGIARSLGEKGVPVIGLTSRKGVYGNYTRYARVRFCPDSRQQPEALFAFLMQLGAELSGPAIIFPTRDDDVLFLDCYREPLSRYFEFVIPSTEAVRACLDKWESYLHACRAGVESPRCWLVQNEKDLARAAQEVEYPCVIKPLSSHLWRLQNNWERVGARKAIAIGSHQQLAAEYAQVLTADPRILIQEMVPGGDDQLFIAACYLNRQAELVASFTAQKLLQCPAGFGTGCIVQTVDRPELVNMALALLRSMRFTGIAEVEFKWDTVSGGYKLIEVNPRPWDHHGLGRAAGVDLIYVAYCDRAGLAMPAVGSGEAGHKWIAEDIFLMAAVRMPWKRDPPLNRLFALARGRRIYGIWSCQDKCPLLAYLAHFMLEMMGLASRKIGVAIGRFFRSISASYDGTLENVKTKG
jgi:D-aspartate ligase